MTEVMARLPIRISYCGLHAQLRLLHGLFPHKTQKPDWPALERLIVDTLQPLAMSNDWSDNSPIPSHHLTAPTSLAPFISYVPVNAMQWKQTTCLLMSCISLPTVTRNLSPSGRRTLVLQG